MAQPQLTSTTAPGKVFESRAELAEHYKSDWHKYNLKRREAGLPLLKEEDFRARLGAALALRREQEGREERTGTDHLKNKKKKNKKKGQRLGNGAAVTKSQAAAYERIKESNQDESATSTSAAATPAAAATSAPSEEYVKDSEMQGEDEEEPPVIEPRQCLFDKHISASLDANIVRMQRKYGFFLPDQEYLVDKEGLLGYCHEKIKLGHCCLYCQKLFTSWQGCQKHMISKRHTKLCYERGVDLDEFDPFYDFSEADAEFLGQPSGQPKDSDDFEVVDDDDVNEDDDDGWEDVTDDEASDVEEGDDDEQEEDGLYAGYEQEIARFGLDVTPLGELVFPNGRIVGHRGLARYYKQRIAPSRDTTAVVAARHAAGERLYRGRIYQTNPTSKSGELTLARAGLGGGGGSVASGRTGNGVLVASGDGGYTSLSLYRYKAVVRKARRENARGQRLEHKSTMNINRMDKKANRLMNGVIVQKALR